MAFKIGKADVARPSDLDPEDISERVEELDLEPEAV